MTKIKRMDQDDYISLTDIAKFENPDDPRFVIQNWMRTRSSIEFLGIWELLNNPDVNRVEFDTVKNPSGSNAFVMPPSKWTDLTGAIGINSRVGRYGGTYAFVGRQVLLDVGGDEFFIDLLFYHLKLRCYVVIELKGGKFKPEHLGQLNFYLTAVDEQVKHPQDNPTIGLLLCRSKNKVVAEYALRTNAQPLGVAEYKLLESLPAELQNSLPSIEQIERELAGDDSPSDEDEA